MIIRFCCPGNSFSGETLASHWKLVAWCLGKGHEIGLHNFYSGIVYSARNMCLGSFTPAGIKQKPYQGKVKYDRLVWIDSDIVFTEKHLEALLDHDEDIVSGVYKMQDQKHYVCCETMNHELFATTGSFGFMKIGDVDARKEKFKADFIGFGFVSIKYGVFESMDYPWFQPVWFDMLKDGVEAGIRDFTGEDIGFCWRAKDLGYDIWIDPKIKVLHRKPFII